MELIRDTVQQLIQQWQTQKKGAVRNDAAQIIKAALSKKAKEHVRFIYCRNGVLGLAVDSSAWKYQLMLDKNAILKKVNKKLKNIKEIRLHIG